MFDYIPNQLSMKTNKNRKQQKEQGPIIDRPRKTKRQETIINQIIVYKNNGSDFFVINFDE